VAVLNPATDPKQLLVVLVEQEGARKKKEAQARRHGRCDTHRAVFSAQEQVSTTHLVPFALVGIMKVEPGLEDTMMAM